MKEINLYTHSGSKNHGCEALVRSTKKVLKDREVHLYSLSEKEDIKYGIDDILDVQGCTNEVGGLLYKIKYKIFKDDILFYKEKFKNFIKTIKKNQYYFSIGGDNYCYKDSRWIQLLNKEINKKGAKTILWGCSINEDELNEKLVEDLNRYQMITVREHLTQKYLKKHGVVTKVRYVPDTAFILNTDRTKISKKMKQKQKFIGINISPVIEKNEKMKGIVYKNYFNLMEYLLNNTEYNIALIPHVVIEENDDRELLSRLYNDFNKNEKIVMIEDCNCEQLKGIISQCEAFIGARTHSTIAAYSSCVPTLVVGYSVKAKGIAEDLFGTTENYVIPTQELRTEDQLTKGMQWIIDNKDEIKTHLEEIMPEYKKQVYKVRDILKEMGI